MPNAWIPFRLKLTRFFLVVLSSTGYVAAAQNLEYVSDKPQLVISSSQGWGELGWDTAAHQVGISGEPIRIGTSTFEKGLGHHANGTILLDLGSDYEAFEAQVGLQPCGGGGSVIFRLVGDGKVVFQSGVLRASDAAIAVKANVRGVQELQLEALDAGDGITCDMANWANARLVRHGGVAPVPAVRHMDVAPFARTITCDPSRSNGVSASRIEEFPAEDVYLEHELYPERTGGYHVPASAKGECCIGLQWLNERAISELELIGSHPSELSTANVQLQSWKGESAWQGIWQPVTGDLQAGPAGVVFRPAKGPGILRTRKIRWIVNSPKDLHIMQLRAFTSSRCKEVRLQAQAQRRKNTKSGTLKLYNCELLSPLPDRFNQERPEMTVASAPRIPWDLATPLSLKLLCSARSAWNSEPSVLQFAIGNDQFAVQVEDILSNGCVYVQPAGIFISLDPPPVSLEAYRRSMAFKRTILEEVRTYPDQTLEQAMKRTHHAEQSAGPVLLSLACENRKFVLEREGLLRFQTSNAPGQDWFSTAGEMRPEFGPGAQFLKRELDGGWLPIPVISFSKDGVLYRERTFVAPLSWPRTNVDASGFLASIAATPSACVCELVVSNSQAAAHEAVIGLTFLKNSTSKQGLDVLANQIVKAGDGVQILVRASPEWRIERGPEATSYSLRLEGGSSARLEVLFSEPSNEPGGLAQETEVLRKKAQDYWEQALAQAAQIETPDVLLNNTIRSSQVRCLIAARNESSGERIAPWIAAMSYGPLESEAHSVLRGMDFLGHSEFARRGLDYFIHRYNTNGFLTTGYTTFGTAWHLWTLAEHVELDHDSAWLQTVAPEITRVGEWILRQRRKTQSEERSQGAREKAPFEPISGLMPPGVLADWNAFAYHYTLNAYYYAALKGLASTLRELPATTQDNWPARAQLFASEAAELRESIRRAYRWTQAQAPVVPLRDARWIPYYPSQVHSPGKLADFFPGQDAGRSWCYDVELGAHQLVPTGVLAPGEPEVGRMLDHMEDAQFLADGWFDYSAKTNQLDWFNLGGFSKVQPYYTRNCEIYAMRDDIKPFVRSYFNTLAAMLNPEVLTLWEHFHHSGAWDKTHETGYFLHQTRTMFVAERGDELWLAPMVTSNWLQHGSAVCVSNAPTRFGPVSYCLRSRAGEGRIEATIQCPSAKPPATVVLRLRHPDAKRIRKVVMNGKRYSAFDSDLGVVRLPGSSLFVSLQVYY